MGMEHLTSAMNPSSGLIHQGNGTMEAMKELQKLRTETMMETCHQSTESRDGAIRCPIPRKICRLYREYDFKAAQDLTDFIVSKASPPHFMGSPPVRASNPLVHDTQFCAWRVQGVEQSLGIPWLLCEKDLLQRLEATFISFMTAQRTCFENIPAAKL